MLSPDPFSSGKVWWSDTNRTTPSVVSCGGDSRILNTYPGEHYHPRVYNHISCLTFQLDLINSSCSATSAFPPQQGTRSINYCLSYCPKELGSITSPLAFPCCASCTCLCKVLRLLHCYGNTTLSSHWNRQPTPIQYQALQTPAKYLSKARLSKANVASAFSKEKGRLFSPNSYSKRWNCCCIQQLCLLLTSCSEKGKALSVWKD